MSEKTIYNFAAGPAMLPTEVHQQIREEWSNWHNRQVPLVEVGHRTKEFMQLMEENENLLRELMCIPAHYRILFLHGGAQMQFALVPMNLLGKNSQADYLVYGHWGRRAYEEACRYGKIKAMQARSMTMPYGITPPAEWQFNPEAAYLHICTNETIDGMRLPVLPETAIPLVADMSSDILSHAIEVEKFGVIYACTQKNMGIAGLAVVIIREDLLDQAMALTPSVLSYKNQTEAKSLYNTNNTFACYVTGLVLQWLKRQGGIETIEKINQRKAAKLYACIDQSKFYINKVASAYRSNMNIIFNLPTPELEELFLQEAEAIGLLSLRGHKVSGGIRASLYNAMPEAGVDKLISFMCQFRENY